MKKLAKESIKRHLESQQRDIQYRLTDNIRKMRDLEKEQARLKRERGIYQELIRSLEA